MKYIKFIVLYIVFMSSQLFSLTNEMLADKHLIAAQKYIKSKEYKRAKKEFEKIFNLRVKIPNDLYYFYAKTLKNNKELEKSLKNFNFYIEKTGRNSKHYLEALKHIIDLEDTISTNQKSKYYAKYIIEHNGLLYQSFNTEKNTPSRLMNWNDALKYCKNLDLNGRGWRLPRVKDVLSMSNVKAFDSGKDYKYRSTHNGGKYANEGSRWTHKNLYRRIPNPSKGLNKKLKNEFMSSDYIFMKDKFIKNLEKHSIYTTRLYSIPTSEIYYSEGTNQEYYFEFSFIKGRLQAGIKSNRRFTTCVKDKY